jgi:hypothetical protein
MSIYKKNVDFYIIYDNGYNYNILKDISDKLDFNDYQFKYFLKNICNNIILSLKKGKYTYQRIINPDNRLYLNIYFERKS